VGGDYTRLTFQPRRDYGRVRMQQGRVQLDADWNEQVDGVDRRLRAETIDLLGHAVVPAETSDGFRIAVDQGTASIGRGRIYLDGLLVENHGDGAPGYDRHLGEPVLQGATPYMRQPYDHEVPPLATDANGIVYLEAWEREVTAVQDAALVEPAVGVDTATRVQAAWRVRFLPTPDGPPEPGDVEGTREWRELVEPPAGRLSASGTYTGGENRLYRVEIHDGGGEGAEGQGASFKWSGVNGSAVAGVRSIDGTRVAIDSALRGVSFPFQRGDWAELLDDRLEIHGRHGTMVEIAEVDASGGVVTLTAPLESHHVFDPTDGDRHTRLRRWDQRGPAVGRHQGVIPIPGDGRVALGDGVEVTFASTRHGRGHRPGDHWVFFARTANGVVETLTEAPPRGMRHRCPLALVQLGEVTSDLRTVRYPATETHANETAGCAVAVSADAHENARLTLQQAVNRVRRDGGSICLGPGVYWLQSPLELERARSVRLSGVGPATTLVYCGEGAAIALDRARGVTIEDLSIVAVGAPEQDPAGLRTRLREGLPAPKGEALEALRRAVPGHRRAQVAALEVRRSADVRLVRCDVYQLADRTSAGPAIALRGDLQGIELLDNVVLGVTGVGTVQGARAVTSGLRIEGNELACELAGIDLDERSVHVAETAIRGNQVRGCDEVGIAVRGFLHGGHPNDERHRLLIEANSVLVARGGIAVTADRARIAGNDVSITGGDSAEGIDVRVSPRCELDVADNSVRSRARPALRIAVETDFDRIVRTVEMLIAENEREIRSGREPVVLAWARGQADRLGRLLRELRDRGHPRSGQLVSVRGNRLETTGPVHVVEVRMDGTCTFAVNQCLRAGGGGHEPAVVSLHVGAAVVNANVVAGRAGQHAVVIECDDGPACVGGNLVEGRVRVDCPACPEDE